MTTTETFNHKVLTTADEDFLQSLRDFLGPNSSLPFFKNSDGTVDREKTLAMPCYENFKGETE